MYSQPSQKKQASCLFVSLTTSTDNSITSRHQRFRSTSLSFHARWAKRKLSYCVQPCFSVCQPAYCVLLLRVCPISVGTRQALLQGWLLCVGFVCLANVPDLVRWVRSLNVMQVPVYINCRSGQFVLSS